MPAGAHLLIWITFNHSIYFILPIPGVKLPCPRSVKIGLVNSCIYYAHQTWNLPGAALLSGFKRSRNPLNKTALCNGNGNKIQWNLNQNILLFFYENALENVVWKMAAILSRPQCVKWNTVSDCVICNPSHSRLPCTSCRQGWFWVCAQPMRDVVTK